MIGFVHQGRQVGQEAVRHLFFEDDSCPSKWSKLKVAVAERLKLTDVATLDHRHFRALVPDHVPAFTLLP